MREIIRKPRIALTSEALQIIKIWATLENKDADQKLSELIIASAPKKVKDLVIQEVPKVKTSEATKVEMADAGKKICHDCKEMKSLAEYYLDRGNKPKAICKTCYKAKMEKRRKQKGSATTR